MKSYDINSASYMFMGILAAVLLTLAVAWVSILIAKRTNLMDIPGKAPHKQHETPTPLAGGIAIFISLIILISVFNLWSSSVIRFMLLTAVVIFIFGVWDDAKGLSAPIKFGGQLLATLLLIFSGVRIEFLESLNLSVGGSGYVFVLLDDFLTVLWVVGITNALNLVDSMDGLAVGLSAWAFGFFMLATFDSQQFILSMVSAVLLGISLSINYYNTTPSRLFLGDAGAQLLGFLLAVIAILYSPQATSQASSWFVPILLLGVPIFDTTLVFVSRLRRGIPFYKGHLDHTYHRLVGMGLTPGRAVLTMHLTAVLLECVAFIAFTLPSVLANGVFGICLLLGVLGIVILDRKKTNDQHS